VLESKPSLRIGLANGAIRGLSLAVALGLSHAAVAVAQALHTRGLLALALMATLLFAISLIAMTAALKPSHAVRSPALSAEAAYLAIGTLGGLLGLAAVGMLIGTSPDFFCASEVPRRVDIAAFGGFALGLLEAMVRRRGFWYGFFHAPAFLAQSVFYPCGGPSLPAREPQSNASIIMLCGPIKALR
jgi:hypothetical protein